MLVVIKKNRTNLIFLSFVALYVNFTFVFRFMPALQYLIYYGVMAGYVCLNINRVLQWLSYAGREKKLFVGSIFLWIIIFVNSILWPLLFGTYDFSYANVVVAVFRSGLGQVFLLLLIDKRMQNGKLLDNYGIISAVSVVLYEVSTIFMIFIPGLKEIWHSIIGETAADYLKSQEANYATRYGLAGFSGFDKTIICSFVANLLLVLICKKLGEKREVNIKEYVFVVLMLVGNTFYGRSGLMITLACIMIVIVYLAVVYEKLGTLVKISVALSLMYLLVAHFESYNETLHRYYNWALIPITNFITKGKIGTDSSDAMFANMYFNPGLKTLFIGDGYYTDPVTGAYYCATDIGLMRPMLFYGVFNQIMGYLVCIFLIIGGSRLLSKGNKKLTALAFFLFVFALMLFEVKGETFYRIFGYVLAIYFASAKQKYEDFIYEQREDISNHECVQGTY